MSVAITHSIGATYQIPPLPSPQGTSTERPGYDGLQDLVNQEIFLQSSAVQVPATSIENNDNDLNLRERLAHQRPDTPRCRSAFPDKNSVASPEGYPGMIRDQNQPKQEEREQEPRTHKIMDENNNEDRHPHKHAGLCADEIGMRRRSYFFTGK